MSNYKDILNSFNIKTENYGLFLRAFTHSSYVHEHEDEMDYEQIEFIGDGVLDLVVADLIFKTYSKLNQGVMTKLRSSIVCGKSLSQYARKYNFGPAIRLGHGEILSGGNDSDKILEDVFEAFIGATYLDQGFEFTYSLIKSITLKDIEEFDLESLTDYKSKLQEEIQSDKRGVIVYRVIKEQGSAQNKTFEVEAIFEDIILGRGKGTSKKRAEQDAARDALLKRVK